MNFFCPGSFQSGNFTKQLKTMGVLRQISEYLYIRKPDPSRPKSQWVSYMHGINRLSILLFILALVILFFKLMRHH
jgi:hypothetical protein